MCEYIYIYIVYLYYMNIYIYSHTYTYTPPMYTYGKWWLVSLSDTGMVTCLPEAQGLGELELVPAVVLCQKWVVSEYLWSRKGFFLFIVIKTNTHLSSVVCTPE